MKKVITCISALALAMVMAFAQQPSREQLEAALSQMPKLPNTELVKIGHLDNGLTYYIRHNELPAGRAEFYLATNVGAIQEIQPDQDGLAHFLEHMCFNGTEHFPGKGILNYLRSIGAEFGRNINASTGFEETRYMLNNIPVQRESVVDSCLMILADYSHFVSNLPEEIDAERGVIIEERRSRRNASWRNMEASLPYYFGPGSHQAECTLIGKQEHLETFKYESLHDFYSTWYHPGNQAVVVVGDVDVDRTEAQIKAIFGVIPAKENPLKKPIQVIEDHDEARVGIITDPESTNPSIDLYWHDAAMPEVINATAVGYAQDMIKRLVSMIMNERFTDITSKAGTPFMGAQFGFSSLLYEDIDAVGGEVALREDNILEGFRAYYTEVQRLKRYGVTDDEFKRAKQDFLSALETSVNRAATRQNAEFINPIISNFFDQYPILEPEDKLEIAQALFGQLNAAAISQTLAQLCNGRHNMIMIYNGPEKEGVATPTAEQLLQIMDEVEASEIAAPAGEEIPEAFLDPAKLKGAKIAKTATTLYGATEWTLKNGVKVIVYPTDLQKDQIIFDLYKAGGLSLIPDEDIASFDDNIIALFRKNSGVSVFSNSVVSKMLTGKNFSVSPYFEALENGINGTSTVKDFETAMQVTYLLYTDPRFDPEEWQVGIDQLKAVLPNLEGQPNYKMQKEVYNTLYGNNPRKSLISQETLSKASLDVVAKNYKKLFADAAGATLVIVGDVNTEAIKPIIEKYIGSLPKGKKALKWVDPNTDVVKGRVEKVFEVDMQTPMSSVIQYYSIELPYSYKNVAAIEAIGYIMDMRYTNSLREEEGGTYGASAYGSLNRRPKQNAFFEVEFDCKPALCDKLREIAIRQFNELAEQGVTDEEMNAAKLNLQKNLPESRQKNSWWRTNIERHLLYNDDRDAAYEAAINGLTKEDIQNLAKEFTTQNNLIEVVMKPAKTAEAE